MLQPTAVRKCDMWSGNVCKSQAARPTCFLIFCISSAYFFTAFASPLNGTATFCKQTASKISANLDESSLM